MCYKTAWLVKHKLLKVMVERDDRRQLDGRVEIDDAYLGGERAGKRGRGSENKAPFVVAVQTSDEGHPFYVRMDRLAFSKEDINRWANQALAASARVVSEGLHCFRAGLAGNVANHQSIVVGSDWQAVEHAQFVQVNTVLGNVKTAISGTHRAVDFAKYAHRYLAEVEYRFNRRFELGSIPARLVRAVATTRPWPVPLLRLAEACH